MEKLRVFLLVGFILGMLFGAHKLGSLSGEADATLSTQASVKAYLQPVIDACYQCAPQCKPTEAPETE